jgi:hypothetical protein
MSGGKPANISTFFIAAKSKLDALVKVVILDIEYNN